MTGLSTICIFIALLAVFNAAYSFQFISITAARKASCNFLDHHGQQLCFSNPSLRMLQMSLTEPNNEKQKITFNASGSFIDVEVLKRFDLPNKLTLSRVLAIPLFILTFMLRKRTLSFLIYLTSCLTDFLDGYLARKWNQTSAFGAFLDPVADKLMVASALILLTSHYPTLFFVFPVAMIMCREIGVSALREWMAERRYRNIVQVGKLGKIKTTMQMISTALLLLVFPGSSTDWDLCDVFKWPKPSIFMAGLICLYLAAFATIVSGVEYFIAAWPKLQSKASTNIPEN